MKQEQLCYKKEITNTNHQKEKKTLNLGRESLCYEKEKSKKRLKLFGL